MIILIDLNFLKEIKSTDLLTYSALLVALLAYCRSINRDLESWKSLLVSFKNDLKSQGGWLSNEYFEETYKDNMNYYPFKIIFPLSFESLPEIIRRGVAEFQWISDKFINNLSLFNERVVAFNSVLDHLKKVIAVNPLMTEKLIGKLSELCINNGDVEFDDLKKKINELKKDDEIFYLAENIRRLNRLVHVKLIGNKNKKDMLHYLHSEITEELESILKNFESKKPWYIRYEWVFIVISFAIFIFIELYFK